jgi:hypothetical protein
MNAEQFRQATQAVAHAEVQAEIARRIAESHPHDLRLMQQADEAAEVLHVARVALDAVPWLPEGETR